VPTRSSAVCGLVSIALTITVIAHFEGNARSAMMGFQSSVGSFAGLLALIASGAIAVRFDWHLAFLLYAVPFVPLAFLAIPAMPAVRPGPRDDSARVIPTVRMFWQIYLAGAMLSLGTTLFGGLTPFLLIDRGVGDPLIQSLVIAMVTLGATFGAAVFGAVQKRVGERLSMVVALTAFAVGAAGLATFGAGIGRIFPWLSVRLAADAPVAMRARAFGLLGTATYLGGFFHPFVAAALTPLVGRGGAFIMLGAAMLAAALIFALRTSGSIRPTAPVARSAT
jgi:MFS family permease